MFDQPCPQSDPKLSVFDLGKKIKLHFNLFFCHWITRLTFWLTSQEWWEGKVISQRWFSVSCQSCLPIGMGLVVSCLSLIPNPYTLSPVFAADTQCYERTVNVGGQIITLDGNNPVLTIPKAQQANLVLKDQDNQPVYISISNTDHLDLANTPVLDVSSPEVQANIQAAVTELSSIHPGLNASLITELYTETLRLLTEKRTYNWFYHVNRNGQTDYAQDHTFMVSQFGLQLAQEYLPDQEIIWQGHSLSKAEFLNLLAIATLRHDIGYAFANHRDNEEAAASATEEWMRDHNYPDWQIQLVADAIRATNVANMFGRNTIVPQNPLALFMVMADLFPNIETASNGNYLLSNLFFQELRHGARVDPQDQRGALNNTDQGWASGSIQFYQTPLQDFTQWTQANAGFLGPENTRLLTERLDRNRQALQKPELLAQWTAAAQQTSQEYLDSLTALAQITNPCNIPSSQNLVEPASAIASEGNGSWLRKFITNLTGQPQTPEVFTGEMRGSCVRLAQGRTTTVLANQFDPSLTGKTGFIQMFSLYYERSRGDLHLLPVNENITLQYKGQVLAKNKSLDLDRLARSGPIELELIQNGNAPITVTITSESILDPTTNDLTMSFVIKQENQLILALQMLPGEFTEYSTDYGPEYNSNKSIPSKSSLTQGLGRIASVIQRKDPQQIRHENYLTVFDVLQKVEADKSVFGSGWLELLRLKLGIPNRHPELPDDPEDIDLMIKAKDIKLFLSKLKNLELEGKQGVAKVHIHPTVMVEQLMASNVTKLLKNNQLQEPEKVALIPVDIYFENGNKISVELSAQTTDRFEQYAHTTIQVQDPQTNKTIVATGIAMGDLNQLFDSFIGAKDGTKDQQRAFQIIFNTQMMEYARAHGFMIENKAVSLVDRIVNPASPTVGVSITSPAELPFLTQQLGNSTQQFEIRSARYDPDDITIPEQSTALALSELNKAAAPTTNLGNVIPLPGLTFFQSPGVLNFLTNPPFLFRLLPFGNLFASMIGNTPNLPPAKTTQSSMVTTSPDTATILTQAQNHINQGLTINEAVVKAYQERFPNGTFPQVFDPKAEETLIHNLLTQVGQLQLPLSQKLRNWLSIGKKQVAEPSLHSQLNKIYNQTRVNQSVGLRNLYLQLVENLDNQEKSLSRTGSELPDYDFNDLRTITDQEFVKLGLTAEWKPLLKSIVDEMENNYLRTKALREQYPDNQDFVAAIYGHRPNFPLDIKISPLYVQVLPTNANDFVFLNTQDPVFLAKALLGSYAEEASEILAQWYGFADTNKQINLMVLNPTKRIPRSVVNHEKQHILNLYVREKILAHFYPDTSTDPMEQAFAKTLAAASQEILAHLPDPDLDLRIIYKQLKSPKYNYKEHPDFFDFEKLIESSQSIEEVKQIDAKYLSLLTNQYHLELSKAFNALNLLENAGLSRPEIIAYLQSFPLTEWLTEARRFYINKPNRIIPIDDVETPTTYGYSPKIQQPIRASIREMIPLLTDLYSGKYPQASYLPNLDSVIIKVSESMDTDVLWLDFYRGKYTFEDYLNNEERLQTASKWIILHEDYYLGAFANTDPGYLSSEEAKFDKVETKLKAIEQSIRETPLDQWQTKDANGYTRAFNLEAQLDSAMSYLKSSYSDKFEYRLLMLRDFAASVEKAYTSKNKAYEAQQNESRTARSKVRKETLCYTSALPFDGKSIGEGGTPTIAVQEPINVSCQWLDVSCLVGELQRMKRELGELWDEVMEEGNQGIKNQELRIKKKTVTPNSYFQIPNSIPSCLSPVTIDLTAPDAQRQIEIKLQNGIPVRIQGIKNEELRMKNENNSQFLIPNSQFSDLTITPTKDGYVIGGQCVN